MRGKFLVGFENEKVILLRFASLIVEFLPCEEQYSTVVKVAVPIVTIYPNIMIGNDNEIEP
jgi:hypothetical protein